MRNRAPPLSGIPEIVGKGGWDDGARVGEAVEVIATGAGGGVGGSDLSSRA
jgi:hypothetical protein